MPAIKLNSNASILAAAIGEIAREQIPYATAQTLTELAFMGQRMAKLEATRDLNLRNRFSQTGIQVNKAAKADWPNQSAEVGIEERRSYLIDHITGGKRQGGTHGRAILAQEELRNPRGRVMRKDRPAAMLRGNYKGGRPKGSRNGQHRTPRLPFLINSSRWGNEVLVRRLSENRYPLLIVYAFKKGVQIKRQFELDMAVQDEVKRNYYRVFAKNLQRAMRNAKTKPERAASWSNRVEIDSGK